MSLARAARLGAACLALLSALVSVSAAAPPSGPPGGPPPGMGPADGLPPGDGGGYRPGDFKVVAPVLDCSDLTTTDLAAIAGPGSRVLKAAHQETRGSPPVCLVEGTLAPAIGFRLQLPLHSWTQRYLQVGCGGLCGRIGLQVGAAEGCQPLRTGGFAIASTDMGHQGNSGAFGRDPQARTDFAWRAVHLTAEASKALIRRFYGRAQAYAYFSGCSDGGREALVEAQRFPKDFDGIIAGAPALNFQVQNGLYHAWQVMANRGPDGHAILVSSRLKLLHRAVLSRCDRLDGLADGLVSDPRACVFDPAVLRCPDPQVSGDTCFSDVEVQAARRLYDGPRDPKTGERLTAGGPMPGSELAWDGVFIPPTPDAPVFSERIALEALQNLIFDPAPAANFRLADLAFDTATFARLRARHTLFDATNPDLSAFEANGGKLILWHGWSDPHISPLNTIAYHEAVEATLGARRTADFERLYLLPGVNHCSGGDGPSALDLLTPMLAWVERGDAPAAVTTRMAVARNNSGRGFGAPEGAADGASAPEGRNGPPSGGGRGGRADGPGGMMGGGMGRGGRGGSPDVRTPDEDLPDPREGRPVYPYPAVATHDGRGDRRAVASFHRGDPLVTPPPPPWAGSDFFRPYVGAGQD